MKADHQNQENAGDNGADAKLWEALGHASRAPAPADFLQSVLNRVEDLEQPDMARAKRPYSLWERWQDLCERISIGQRVALSFATIALITGVSMWPQFTPRPVTQPGADSPVAVTVASDTPAELFALQDDEVQTILQLDDYIAFADTGVAFLMD